MTSKAEWPTEEMEIRSAQVGFETHILRDANLWTKITPSPPGHAAIAGLLGLVVSFASKRPSRHTFSARVSAERVRLQVLAPLEGKREKGSGHLPEHGGVSKARRMAAGDQTKPGRPTCFEGRAPLAAGGQAWAGALCVQL